MIEAKCTAITKTGHPCQAPRIPGTDRCFWHGQPEKARQAAAKGGRKTANKPFNINADIKTRMELEAFLHEALKRTALAFVNISEGDIHV